MMFFESYYRQGELLPDEERLKLYDHILRFYFDNTEGELYGLANLVWVGIKPILERSKETETKSSEGGKKSRKQKDKQSETKNIRTLKTKNISTLKTKNITEGKGEEKEKECIKDNNIYSADVKTIVDYLNEKTGSSYRATTKATARHINARLNEGFTVDDCKKVIDIKYSQWAGGDMAKYLRPETLFGGKFEGYLNEKGAENGASETTEGWGKDLDKDPYAYWK